MPPKRKSGKKKNKSKGRAGHGRSSAQNRNNNQRTAAPSFPRTTTSSSDASSNDPLPDPVPTQWEKSKRRGGKNNDALHQDYQTVYRRYKKATSRFIDYMIRVCPAEVVVVVVEERNHSTGDDGDRDDGGNESNLIRYCNANSLVAAADWMERSAHAVERSILRDLRLAIRIRTRVAKSVFGGGDAGHKHFLSILTYCWFVLKRLPLSARENNDDDRASSSKDDDPTSGNHFEVLMEDDDEDDEEDDDDVFPSEPVPRPSPLESKPMTLDELMKTDDRCDAIIFLLNLDEIMGAVREQYRTSVLKSVRFHQSIPGCPDSAIVEDLLEAAVSTNLAIQMVQKLEMDLTVQHPHLTTPYRLLALVVLPSIIQNLAEIVRQHAGVDGCTERDISVYFGDSLEFEFRAPSDPLNRKEQLRRDFCRKWRLDPVGVRELENLMRGLEAFVRAEVPIGPELTQNAFLWSSGLSGTEIAWLKLTNIGGTDRKIHHTLRLLQGFGAAIKSLPHDKRLTAKRGFFGRSPWVPGRSKTIADLDELLLADILPNWVLMCRKGIVSKGLPREDEICPLFVALRTYIKAPDKPVSWSVAFAVHAMTTAVLEVDPVVNRISEITKSVFRDYHEQLDWAIENAKELPGSIGDVRSNLGKQWFQNMLVLRYTKNLGLPVFGDRTLWNPLCGGTILSYLCYFGNVEAGCCMVDCHAQLRIVLHLFHALTVRGLIPRGGIPFLDIFHDALKGHKAIWGGSRDPPRRGEFTRRFWISFGSNPTEARRLATEAEEQITGTERPRPQRRRTSDNPGRLFALEPSELFKSYRRICDRDFSDVVDNYHSPEQRARNKGTDLYRIMVNMNDTADAILEEQLLLSLNLPNCGVLFEMCVDGLGRILNWEGVLKRAAAASSSSSSIGDGGENQQQQRQVFAFLFAQHLLAALDFVDDDLEEYAFMERMPASLSAYWLTEYFNRLNPSKFRWFQATKEVD